MLKVQLVLSIGFYALPSHILFPEHLSAKCRVPILQIDDEIIIESPAVMTAMSQMAAEKRLMGYTDLNVIQTYKWLNKLSGTLHTLRDGALLRPERFIDNERLYAVVRAKEIDKLKGRYEVVDRKLEGKKWAVGHEFTAVDAYLFVSWEWGSGPRFVMSELYPNYARLALELSKRQTVKEEGIKMMEDYTM
ncbi:hypothetical protein K504DRAFT_507707 [Pleomassaria siparia CBS 279.74]|uniref:GST C-terminal domain-containing protein n=1 Tax=Pleomassaria siparia CBS 279.74 TaxID=1314801 RepID=A0A6G1JT58_9PLEO|nr:hypothetical protein K504DRAFT_507707 [Pleomassaria siparia CBS 279.74]